MRIIANLMSLAATSSFLILCGALNAEPIPDSARIFGIAIGCQAYTFNRFSVFEAIEKTADAGGKIIEFYPGQKLSLEEPNAKWDHNASDEVIDKVKAQLARFKIRPVNYGVVGAGSETEWRKIFVFAKKLGFYGITTESVN